MFPFFLGFILGEHEENKQGVDYKKIDIKNLENTLGNARLAQYGENKYFMEGDTFKNQEEAKNIRPEIKKVLNRLLSNYDIQKHELELLIEEITKEKV